MFFILLFKLLTQFPFVSFLSISILSLLPFLNPLSSPSPPSLLSLLINYLSSEDKDLNLLHSVHQWHIFLHSVSYHDIYNAFYKLEKTKF